MYVHFTTLRWLLWRPRSRPQSWRAWFASFGGLALYAVLLSLVQVSRALDYVFFPAFRRQVVETPIFIVATPRSGTTYLHNLLALDDDHFTHFRLYQTVFPTVGVDRVVAALASVERATRIPLSGVVEAFNRRLFPGWDGIHQVGIDAEEEDEALFVHALVSPALYLLQPDIERIPELQSLDDMPARVRDRIAKDYRRTLQRHLFSHQRGESRRMLVKNCLLASRIRTTLREFPDARVIRLVRDPVRAIPSAMSLFTTAWSGHSPELGTDSRETRALASMFIDHYRTLHEVATQEPDRVLTIAFESFVADPMATLERIYAFLGLTLSDSTRSRFGQEVERRRSFQSGHRYALSDFGLSELDVQTPLLDLLPSLGYANSVATEKGSEYIASRPGKL